MSDKIVHNRLYKVTKNFLASPREGRTVEVVAGEVVEFRFFHPVNFRTVDDLYLRVEEEEFIANTEPFADILENIAFRNKNSLKEILDAKLYEQIISNEE